MKTRISLVSNSSSSSFILIGIPVKIYELNETCLKQYQSEYSETIFGTTIIGKCIGEGRDVFSLTDAGLLAFIQDNPEFFQQAFIKSYYIYDPDGMYLLTDLMNCPGTDPSKMVIIGGVADQSSSHCLDQALVNYEEDLSKKMVKDIKQQYKQKYTPK
jgi:hypothetical protein